MSHISCGLINSCHCKQLNCWSHSDQWGGILHMSDGRRFFADSSMFVTPQPLSVGKKSTSTEEISACVLQSSRHQSCVYWKCYVWMFSHKDYVALKVSVTFSLSVKDFFRQTDFSVCVFKLGWIDVHIPTYPWFKPIKSYALIVSFQSNVILPQHIPDVLVKWCFLHV